MTKLKVKKLLGRDWKCPECDGWLVRTSREELGKAGVFLKMGYKFPRGLWRCDDCGEIMTISVIPVDLKRSLWREEIESLSDSAITNEQEVMSAIMDMAMVSASDEVEMISITEALKCEGRGPGCRYYWLASCGIGIKEICGSRNCAYDPYSPDWYRQLMYDNLMSGKRRPAPDMTVYWIDMFGKFRKARDLDAQADALRRLGAFASIDEVRLFLSKLMLDESLEVQLREIAINALSNTSNPEKLLNLKEYLLAALHDKDLAKTRRAVILAIRKMRFTDIEIMERIAIVSGSRALTKEARVTLRILEKASSIRKRS